MALKLIELLIKSMHICSSGICPQFFKNLLNRKREILAQVEYDLPTAILQFPVAGPNKVYLADVQVHFFCRRLFANGPQFLKGGFGFDRLAEVSQRNMESSLVPGVWLPVFAPLEGSSE
ncbi:MAG: hypothetical protein HW380_455 [Magnetococcales bacterium]|nr:hypothetical protein [Magnetococcales bacterium]